MHPWIAFCEAALVCPDTLKSYDELAVRYEQITGRSILPSEVRKTADDWARHIHETPSIALVSLDLVFRENNRTGLVPYDQEKA